MKIAIIGGGASGLVAAYLLRDRHQLDLFEKRDVLGGNIRTLNKNVDVGSGLPAGVHIENGVLGFHEASYPRFHRLMAELGIEPQATSIRGDVFYEDGSLGSSPIASRATRIRRDFDNYSLFLRLLCIPARMLRGTTCGVWLTGLSARVRRRVLASFMLSYSMPFRAMDDFPAEIGMSMLRAMSLSNRWNVLPGGVYTYVERMLERARSLRIRTKAGITSVARHRDGVRLSCNDGSTLAYDKVIFATTPEEVLTLLADPSDAEKRRFGAWKKNTAVTIAHTDRSLYAPYGEGVTPGIADRFARSGGADFAYNTYMNDVYGIAGSTGYSFAFNLDDRIAPERVLDRHAHDTPCYTVAAIQPRSEIIETNGTNHTYHVGAYLGNALHEGAVASAETVSKKLGGRGIG